MYIQPLNKNKKNILDTVYVKYTPKKVYSGIQRKKWLDLKQFRKLLIRDDKEGKLN